MEAFRCPGAWGRASHFHRTTSSRPRATGGGRPGACTAGQKGGSAWAGHWAWAGHCPRPRAFLQSPPSSTSRGTPVRRYSQCITALLCPAEPRWGLSVELCPGAAGRTAFRDTPGKWVWLRPQEGIEAQTEDAAGSKGTGRKQVRMLVKVARRDTPAAPRHQEIPQKVAGPRAAMGGRCLRGRAMSQEEDRGRRTSKNPTECLEKKINNQREVWPPTDRGEADARKQAGDTVSLGPGLTDPGRSVQVSLNPSCLSL